MAIPAWNVVYLLPIQDLLAIDKVLENLVEGVTTVQVPVCVRGTIVQDKTLRSCCFSSLRQLVVELGLLPVGLKLRFADSGVGPL